MTDVGNTFNTARFAFLGGELTEEDLQDFIRTDKVMSVLDKQPVGKWQVLDYDTDDRSEDELEDLMKKLECDNQILASEWDDVDIGSGGVEVGSNDNYIVIEIWYTGNYDGNETMLTTYVFMEK